jgi:uncharacterized protein (DUF2147 family)
MLNEFFRRFKMRKELISINDISGGWVSDNEEVKMQIYKDFESGFFNGRITWIIEDETSSDGPVLDALNPDKELQKRCITGIDFISGLSFDQKKKEWKSGELYNPEDGKKYHLRTWLLEQDTLILRPSMDAMGLLGRNFRWYRLSE